ncbi:hypothetical protein [Arthrospiribacter ruber]|uniref:Uncharacterized protein n=1 Tax=Arthrospiribacter ruber TaxID=2487934 RepID=A0A951MAH9_9BACT|nr:hypothetical protein [Arthrospiribacter ruber]MBW3466614.1 hypothetical protein [Arthrospiribacter ruber]
MKRDYICRDCGIDTNKGKDNFYGVTEELWNKYGVGKGMLCLGCFKKRLGREFTREDFVPCVLNYFVNPIVRDIINPTEEECNDLRKKNR